MSEKDLIVCIFAILVCFSICCSWGIASIRDELRQVIKYLKEMNK